MNADDDREVFNDVDLHDDADEDEGDVEDCECEVDDQREVPFVQGAEGDKDAYEREDYHKGGEIAVLSILMIAISSLKSLYISSYKRSNQICLHLIKQSINQTHDEHASCKLHILHPNSLSELHILIPIIELQTSLIQRKHILSRIVRICNFFNDTLH